MHFFSAKICGIETNFAKQSGHQIKIPQNSFALAIMFWRENFKTDCFQKQLFVLPSGWRAGELQRQQRCTTICILSPIFPCLLRTIKAPRSLCLFLAHPHISKRGLFPKDPIANTCFFGFYIWMIMFMCWKHLVIEGCRVFFPLQVICEVADLGKDKYPDVCLGLFLDAEAACTMYASVVTPVHLFPAH